MSAHIGTLAQTERALAPLVRALLAACTLAGVGLLIVHAEPLAVAAWLALAASNALCLRRNHHVSVGMVPPAVASLAPACTSALAGHASAAHVLPAWLRVACLAGLVLSAGTACVFLACFARMRSAYRRHPAVADDAIVLVLGGAVAMGKPRPTLARRLDVAYELAEAHPHLMLVLTGGPLYRQRDTEADAMARYLRNKGVARERLLLERRARNTRENIVLSRDLLAERGLAGQLCVLSSDFHLWRAVREGRAAGVELTPVAAPTPATSRLQQWCREALTILAGR